MAFDKSDATSRGEEMWQNKKVGHWTCSKLCMDLSLDLVHDVLILTRSMLLHIVGWYHITYCTTLPFQRRHLLCTFWQENDRSLQGTGHFSTFDLFVRLITRASVMA